MDRIKKYPWFLLLCTVSLSAIGVRLIGSAQAELMLRQAAGAAVGTVLMVLLSLADYRRFVRLGWLLYAGTAGLLLAVAAAGSIAGGSARWVDIGIVRFQPSELAKIGLILFFAWFFEKQEERMGHLQVVAGSALLAGLPVLLILRQPDLSTAIVTAWVFVCMLFLAGIPWKLLGKIAAVLVPAMAGALYLVTRPEQRLIDEYQYRRIMAWLFPQEWSQEAYQQRNSIMAIASGLLWGKGLNNADSGSVKNGGFLPEAQTDFIMAVAGEELGFAGCMLILALLFGIVAGCLAVGVRARDRSGQLICGGMAGLIGGQAFVNLGVVTGLLPNTGLTLPFVSYGLTSLLSLFLGMGLVLNVGLQARMPQRKA